MNSKKTPPNNYATMSYSEIILQIISLKFDFLRAYLKHKLVTYMNSYTKKKHIEKGSILSVLYIGSIPTFIFLIANDEADNTGPASIIDIIASIIHDAVFHYV